MIRIAPRALAAALAALAALAPSFTSAQTRYEAEVRRTAFGIAHVKANDYAGIGYGVGYAFAQDNVCMIADEFVTVRGERSRYFGPTGTTPYQVPNLAADFFYAFVNGDAAPLQAGLASMQPAVQAAFRGWVAGYNRYLRDTGAANLPAPCTNAAWVRPIDEIDMMRLVRRYALEASSGSGSLLGGIVAARPPAATGAAGDAEPKLGPKASLGIPGFDLDFWQDWKERMGSNALAVGSEGTDNGRGLLLGNPHFPWTGTLRFYQFHITIPGEIDVMGASLSGFPLVNIGFNNDVAWSHTVDTVSHFTIYRLRLDAANPLKYVVDGQVRDLQPRTVTVQVKQADGSLAPQSNTFYVSHLGPVITSSALPIPWTREFAYVIKDANLDNWRLGDQWYAINRAKDTAGVKAALASEHGIPWVNTIAADRHGNALYADISTAPNVPREKQNRCTPDVTFAVVFASAGVPVLDGSRAECDWDVADGTRQPGLLPPSRMPVIERTDYVQNSNDSYWLTNPAVAAYHWDIPAVVGRVPLQQALRTRLGIAQALARLSGTDGLGGNKFTLPILQQIALSNRSLAGDLFMPDVTSLCTTAAAAAVQAECAALALWDKSNNLTSRSAHLFKEFFTRASAITDVYSVPFNYLDPVNTPRGFNVGNAAIATSLVAALKAAGDAVRAAGLPIDAPLGQVQFTLRGTRAIPIHGGRVGSGEIYNAISTALVPGLGYVPTTGTSYIQTVQFTDAGVNAAAFLSYSQSTNPASPHFADQTERFSARQWITLPFTESAILADPAYRTTTIRE
jgi:acyl-homoserine-lactone acylase